MELSIVLPVRNEMPAIPSVTQGLRRHLPKAELIAVDDCSDDGSGRLLADQGFKVLRNERRMGYGYSLKRGLAACSGAHVAFLDCDNTYQPMDLTAMYRRMRAGGADCVWGNRMARHGSLGFVRTLGNQAIILLFRARRHKDCADCCSGMRIYRRDALAKIDFRLLGDGFDFIVGLTRESVRQGLKIDFYDVGYEKRLGDSKLHEIRDFLSMASAI